MLLRKITHCLLLLTVALIVSYVVNFYAIFHKRGKNYYFCVNHLCILDIERHRGRIIYLEYCGDEIKETYLFVGKVVFSSSFLLYVYIP